ENFEIVAAFDSDPDKTGRVVCGRRCYPMHDLETVIRENQITTALIAVPAESAHKVAQTLVNAGVRAILNFAPIHIQVPGNVYIDTLDMTMAVEKAIYFSRQNLTSKEGQQ
ncbi:MAG: redox-sensing transcriptional repressor Rex, partial [Candidatus Riflebacteria bacterium]